MKAAGERDIRIHIRPDGASPLTLGGLLARLIRDDRHRERRILSFKCIFHGHILFLSSAGVFKLSAGAINNLRNTQNFTCFALNIMQKQELTLLNLICDMKKQLVHV